MAPREPRVRRFQSAGDQSSLEDDNDENLITVLGFGSLLSERSSRMTFPNLLNFRLGRIPKYQRVFGHPASIFVERGIANLDTLEVSSLSAEYQPDSPGFICSVFEVPNDNMMSDGVPSEAFLEREAEFNIIMVPFVELDEAGSSSESEDAVVVSSAKKGILCTKSTDEEFIQRGWQLDSGLRPCPVYLRHCVLAAKSMGPECYDSFLDDTVLVDRKTTVRQYLEQNPQVLLTEPPPDLAVRYGG